MQKRDIYLKYEQKIE